MIRISKSFFRPTRLKQKLFLIFALVAFFGLLMSLPSSFLYDFPQSTFSQLLFAALMPLYAGVFAPIFILQAWFSGIFHPDGISISITQSSIESIVIFFIQLIYSYVLSCLLAPILLHARSESPRRRILFLLLFISFFILIYLSFYLSLFFFIFLPIFIILSGIYLYYIRLQRELRLLFTFFVGMLLFSMWLIAYDIFQDVYCIRTPPPTLTETTTNIPVMEDTSQEETLTPVGNCFQNFQLLPALMEELSKSILSR